MRKEILIPLTFFLIFCTVNVLSQEPFTITCDKDVYVCLQNCEAICNVTNNLNRAVKVNVSAIFPAYDGLEPGTIYVLDNVTYNVTVPDYGYLNDICVDNTTYGSWVYNDNYSSYVCSVGNITKYQSCVNLYTVNYENDTCEYIGVTGYHEEERWKYDWKPLDRQWIILLPAKKQKKGEYTNGGNGIAYGSTATFKFQFKVPINSQGKFDIKAETDTGELSSLDPWWSSSWKYRRPITINNTQNSNNLTNYQVAINLTYNSHMQPDLSDIRFTWLNTTDNTEIEIPYWIETYRYYIKVNAYYSTGTTCISRDNSGWNYFDSITTWNSYGTNDWYTRDFWSCDNCDYYAKINLTIDSGVKNVKIEIKSDDGHALWVNGNYVGSCGGSGGNICHLGGTCTMSWDITNYLVYGNNEIRIWCSEATGDEYCQFRLLINDKDYYTNDKDYYTKDFEGDTAWVWVRVPYIPANGYSTIYVYYGNTTPVSSLSNQTAVCPGGSATIDGKKECYEIFDSFSNSTWFNTTNGVGGLLRSQAKFYPLTTRAETCGQGNYAAYDGDGYGLAGGCAWWYNNNPVWAIANASTYPQFANWGAGILARWYFKVYYYYSGRGNGPMNLTINNIVVDSRTIPGTFDWEMRNASISTTLTTVQLKFIHVKGDNGIIVDYLRIRKYTDPEPTYSIGAEEISTYISVTFNYNYVTFTNVFPGDVNHPADGNGYYNININTNCQTYGVWFYSTPNLTYDVYEIPNSNLKFNYTIDTTQYPALLTLDVDRFVNTTGYVAIYPYYYLDVPLGQHVGNYTTTQIITAVCT